MAHLLPPPYRAVLRRRVLGCVSGGLARTEDQLLPGIALNGHQKPKA